jgi:hypothetical protein
MLNGSLTPRATFPRGVWGERKAGRRVWKKFFLLLAKIPFKLLEHAFLGQVKQATGRRILFKNANLFFSLFLLFFFLFFFPPFSGDRSHLLFHSEASNPIDIDNQPASMAAGASETAPKTLEEAAAPVGSADQATVPPTIVEEDSEADFGDPNGDSGKWRAFFLFFSFFFLYFFFLLDFASDDFKEKKGSKPKAAPKPKTPPKPKAAPKKAKAKGAAKV